MVDKQHFWIGSTGPFIYDADKQVNDANLDYDGAAAPDQAPLIATSQLNIKTAPAVATEVLRLDDVGGLCGNVNGPVGGSTDEAVVRFDGTSGKILQDSLVIINDVGGLFAPNITANILYKL